MLFPFPFFNSPWTGGTSPPDPGSAPVGGSGNGSSGAGTSGSPFSPHKPRKAIGTPVTRLIINLGVTLVFTLIYFFLNLPAINFHDSAFYTCLFLCLLVYLVTSAITYGVAGDTLQGYLRFVKKQCRVPAATVLVLAVVMVLGSLSSWVVFRAKSYSELLPVETGDFAADVEEIVYNQIPMVDKDSAQRLGTRKLGELSDMVSQFEVRNDFTQINYQGRPVRVASLRYADIIKWFTNRSGGLPAYLIVDMVTQDVTVVRLKEGIRYTPAEHLFRNLYRYLRLRYPTMMFAEPVFEIDEEGNPWWVCPRLVKTIGLFGGIDIRGAVLVNAVSGEHRYYEEVPQWVDQVYVADLIMLQYDYYGLYHNGFLNSVLGQKEVTQTTSGYNYIAIDDDVYVYTGVTSVTSDQSNIGFLLTNQRTKQTHFYPVAGATETSAQESAQSQVQQMRYRATFPLLLNISGQPTYFMALKGDDGLVKMYAMVNVQQYSIVSTGSTVALCETNYRQALTENNLIEGSENILGEEVSDISGIIQEIRETVINGTSHYFLLLQSESNKFYQLSAADPRVILLQVGDSVDLRYNPTQLQTLKQQEIYPAELADAA